MTNSDLDALKKLVPMHLVAQGKMDLERRGEEFWSLCPFKQEKTPSFSIYQTEDGSWMYKCFGCQVSGNIYQLVQQLDKVSFAEAVKIVRELARNPEWEQMRADADAVFQQTKTLKKEVITVPLAAFDKYARDMQTNPTALAWLKSRGITKETAEQFSLGYVQQPLPQIVPTNHPWSNKGWVLFPEIRNGRIVSVKYRSVMGKKCIESQATKMAHPASNLKG